MRGGLVREEEKPCGQWHFLVGMCHWRFQTADVLSVGSDDDSKVIDQVFAGLELGTVRSCTVATPSYDLEIHFSTGQRFNTFQHYPNQERLGTIGIFIPLTTMSGCQTQAAPFAARVFLVEPRCAIPSYRRAVRWDGVHPAGEF